MREHSEELQRTERVFPITNRFKLMPHELRMQLIFKPFPRFNIVKTQYAGANRGLTYPSTPVSERSQLGVASYGYSGKK